MSHAPRTFKICTDVDRPVESDSLRYTEHSYPLEQRSQIDVN